MDSSANTLKLFLATVHRTGGDFLDWWLCELGRLIPLRIRHWWRGNSQIALVALHEAHAVFSHPTERGVEEQFRIEASDTGLVLSPSLIQSRLEGAIGPDYQLLLVLERQQTLLRTLTLPVALAENLRQTLSFELDRYTPFRTDQAYFDYRLLPASTDTKTISVELAVIPRNAVDRPVAELARQGINVAGAVLLQDFDAPGTVVMNFLPTAPFTRRPSVHSRRRIAFATLAFLLLLTLLAIPLWKKRMTAIALLQPAAQAQAAAMETDGLREKLAEKVEGYNFLLNKKWASYSATQVLEELTKLLPDDTYIVGFDFDGKSIQAQGETASSINMIEILEASPLFKDVAYKSPLTKIQGSQFDRFHISATLEGAGQPQPKASAQKNGIGVPDAALAPQNTTGNTPPAKP